jgi:glycosyltransferase involved in cell wall biosynthesis
MTITVALIVKDEERTLGRCLESVAGAVDEIVVVDTGSTDATKEIARRYTDRLYDFEWRQDFAAARQYAFDRATSDWIAWVDADDVVRHAGSIRPLIDAAPADVDGFRWPYEYERDEWGNAVCRFWRERCVRNNGAFRWLGRVHEVLAGQRPCKLVRSEKVIIEHHRERASVPQKLRRNLDILENEYQEARRDGRKPAPRLLFYLASEYTSAGETSRALSLFEQYLLVGDWEDERYLAQTRVADIFRWQRRYEEAINADLQALKICPHWPDAYFGLAETYYYKQDWHKVIHWTELGRAMPQPDTLHILNPLDYSFNWIVFYTAALSRLGEMREALDWTRRALFMRPDDERHRRNFLTMTRALQDETHAPLSGPADIHMTTSYPPKPEPPREGPCSSTVPRS